MTSWDIKPQGVQGHLKTVGGNAGELETALNTLLTAMSEAAQAAGTAVPGSQSGMTPQGPLAPGAGLTRVRLLWRRRRRWGRWRLRWVSI